uniref:Nucleolar protein 56 n=1 Tax=Globodera rostochiensis TaxID=31243 RepID=A0A914HXE5_GLORO
MTTSEAPNYALYEHAVGYTMFKIKAYEDIGQIQPEVQSAMTDAQRFQAIVQVHAFEPFRNTEAALENANSIADGVVHVDLLNFLEANLPKKKKKVLLGVGEQRLAASLVEAMPGLLFLASWPIELMRGIRSHFRVLAKDLPHAQLGKAQLSLGHSFSRAKVKFDVHRVDNMVIQSIALLDQLDKDINLFGMRIKEWYAYHYPELIKIVPELYNYVRCATAIMDREKMDEAVEMKIKEILQDEQKAMTVIEAARTSMGMQISELDLQNIELFAKRVASLAEYRQRLHQYIKDRMEACAPSLSTLIGEQVGARLISHAGSLTNLAKALKTRANTPKYGLLFHSSFIGRAQAKHKGRISRFLANKCSLASRIDCFSDVPVSSYGEALRKQVEERLVYYEKGVVPKKNVDVMQEAVEEATVAVAKVLKKRRKAAKRMKMSRETISSEGATE